MICVAESLCYPPEVSGYTPIQNKKFNKKKLAAETRLTRQDRGVS